MGLVREVERNIFSVSLPGPSPTKTNSMFMSVNWDYYKSRGSSLKMETEKNGSEYNGADWGDLGMKEKGRFQVSSLFVSTLPFLEAICFLTKCSAIYSQHTRGPFPPPNACNCSHHLKFPHLKDTSLLKSVDYNLDTIFFFKVKNDT